MRVKVKEGEVAVDHDYYWQPMDTCPLNAKVQLLGLGGVAVYGKYNGKDDFWQYWAPMPKVPKDPAREKTDAS